MGHLHAFKLTVNGKSVELTLDVDAEKTVNLANHIFDPFRALIKQGMLGNVESKTKTKFVLEMACSVSNVLVQASIEMPPGAAKEVVEDDSVDLAARVFLNELMKDITKLYESRAFRNRILHAIGLGRFAK